jgi:hypothetical protein
MQATIRNRQTILRCFVPHSTPFPDSDGFFVELDRKALSAPPGQRNGIPVLLDGAPIGDLFDRAFGAKVGEVAAGDTIATPRVGQPEHQQQFAEAGYVFDFHLPAALAPTAKRLASKPGAGVRLGFHPSGGQWTISSNPGPQFRERVYRASSARLSGIAITTGESNHGTSVCVIE